MDVKALIGIVLVLTSFGAVPQMIKPEIFNQDQEEIVCHLDEIVKCNLETKIVINL